MPARFPEKPHDTPSDADPAVSREDIRDSEAVVNLRQRIRRGSDGFEFDALLDGVSAKNKPTAVPPATPAPRPRRYLLWTALLLVLCSTAYVVVRRVSSRAPASLSVVSAPKNEMPPVSGFPLRGLPDPALTPGEQDEARFADMKIAPEVRRGVFTRYGLAQDDRHFVLCRLIPYSLHGTNNPANLFPTTPWFAELKGRLDRFLTTQVSEQKMTISEARTILTTHWVKALHTYNIRNYGESDADRAREIDEMLGW